MGGWGCCAVGDRCELREMVNGSGVIGGLRTCEILPWREVHVVLDGPEAGVGFVEPGVAVQEVVVVCVEVWLCSAMEWFVGLVVVRKRLRVGARGIGLYGIKLMRRR